MFFTRLLLLILALVAVRFIFRFVRTLVATAPRRPEVRSGRKDRGDPTRGKRIIDVEFTEDGDGPR